MRLVYQITGAVLQSEACLLLTFQHISYLKYGEGMYRKMNNFLFRSLSENDKSQIEKLVYEIATESHKTEDNLTPLDMLRHGNLCKTLNLWFAWIMACVSYYALSLNAADLSGNIILNYLLSQLISIPGAGITSFAINKIGRKFTLGMHINYIMGKTYTFQLLNL